jgi:hypothetical protein
VPTTTSAWCSSMCSWAHFTPGYIRRYVVGPHLCCGSGFAQLSLSFCPIRTCLTRGRIQGTGCTLQKYFIDLTKLLGTDTVVIKVFQAKINRKSLLLKEIGNKNTLLYCTHQNKSSAQIHVKMKGQIRI